MLTDEVITRAKQECEEYMAHEPHSVEETPTALGPVLKTVNAVLVGTRLMMGMSKKGPIALELFVAKKELPEITHRFKISLLQDGSLVREDHITCSEGCHELGGSIAPITIENVLKMGVTGKDLVLNAQRFLEDPHRTFQRLTDGVKN